MVFENINRLILRCGLTVAAALLSAAAFAQEVPDPQVTDPTDTVETGVDPVPTEPGTEGGEGIAVGEPDPSDIPDIVIDDGAFVIGDDTPLDDSPIYDGPVEDTPLDDGPVEDTPLDDGPVEDSPVQDGTDFGVDDGLTLMPGDGEVVLYTMQTGAEVAGADICTDCNAVMAQTAAAVVATGATDPVARAALSANRNHPPTSAFDRAGCLALHPRATWICEWQTGAGN